MLQITRDMGTERRAGSVQVTTHRIAENVEKLEETVAELFERLKSVLSTYPVPEDGSKKDSNVKPSQPCDLATHLDCTADRVSSVGGRLREIIDRLEV